MKLTDISIKKKLYVLSGLGIFFFICTLAIGIFELKSITSSAQILGKPKQDSALLAAEVAHLRWDIAVQAYILAQGKNPLKAALDGHSCDFGKWFYGPSRLQLESELPAIKPYFANLEPLHLNLHDTAKRIKGLVEANNLEEATAILDKETMPLLNQIAKLLTVSRAQITMANDNTLQQLLTLTSDLEASTMVLGVIIILVGSLIAVVVTRSISNPLIKLAATAREISSGNFITANLNRKDEVGQLADAFDIMVHQLKEKLGVSQGIMHGITNPFIVCNTKDEITFLNAPMLKTWGRSGTPKDYLNQTSGQFFYDKTDSPTLITRCLSRKEAERDFSMTHVNFANEKKHLRLDTSPLYGLEGNLIGAFAIHTDLTENHVQRERISSLNDHIYQSANEAKDISIKQNLDFQDLTTQLDTTAKMSKEQSTAASQAASILRNMTETLEEMAQSANQTVEKSQEARTQAMEGVHLVQETMSCIERMSVQTEQVAAGMRDLNEYADGIGQVLDLIKDVADQTNLLALNAAIEAARAGDAGRGFAVVADEVRKLAEKTMQATGEVATAVHSIQEGVQTGINATKEAVKLTNQSTALAQRTSNNLNHLSQVAEIAATNVTNIAKSTQDQLQSSHTILATMENITSLSTETNTNMTQSTTLVKNLNTLSIDLKTIIESMRNERRISDRIEIRTPYTIQLRCSVANKNISCQLADISITGMRVKLAPGEVCNTNNSLHISASQPPFHEVFNETLANISWMDGNELGIQFDKPLTADIIALSKQLQTKY